MGLRLPFLNSARRHPVVAGFALAAAVAALLLGIREGKPLKGIAYPLAMLAGVLAVDFLEGRRPPPGPLPVRRPGLETTAVALCLLLGLAALGLRFLSPVPFGQRPSAERLALGMASLLFALPVAMAGFLLLRGYGPRELGLRFRGLAAGAAVLAITAGAALLADPEGVTLWPALAETGGWGSLLVMGFLSAALPEEFTRVALQTRAGALLRNPAAGWLLSTAAWSLLHVPVYGRGPDGDLPAALLGAIRIVPIGLLWGYLTHRTGSLLPATLAHGLNLWGLQNS
jgi:membrane protease YdiL (CAAX protease family)